MTSTPFAFSSDPDTQSGSDSFSFAAQSPALQNPDSSRSDMGLLARLQPNDLNGFFPASGFSVGSQLQDLSMVGSICYLTYLPNG